MSVLEKLKETCSGKLKSCMSIVFVFVVFSYAFGEACKKWNAENCI